jgi:4-diphosphocytidyl-2-C-methyl-D-erythritol kinase
VFYTDTPAKLNLTLDVLGKRPDGYHDLCSLVMGIGWYDRLWATRRERGASLLHCTQPELNGPENLVLQAVQAFSRRTGRRLPLQLQLDKHLPVAAGLGGGSSDAAATLRLCNRIGEFRLSGAQLGAIGATVGSDVPLFFSLPAAVMRGRGEEVTPVELAWSGYVLLVVEPVAVSTPAVFADWHHADANDLPRDQAKAAAAATTAEELASSLSNHLEPAIFRVAPAVRIRYDALSALGMGTVRVSGAGSTLYMLFDDEPSARAAQVEVDRQDWGVATRVVPAPVGPGPVVCEE